MIFIIQTTYAMVSLWPTGLTVGGLVSYSSIAKEKAVAMIPGSIPILMQNIAFIQKVRYFLFMKDKLTAK